MAVSLYGVRHHGPGCARSLLHALEESPPDAVLIEGPPEIEAIAEHAAHPEMRPPVAVLLHAPGVEGRGVFYPLAEFSPEWQAMRWAQQRGVPVRFFDLPAAHSLAVSDDDGSNAQPDEQAPDEQQVRRADPIAWLAEAAGEQDAERWWERMVEERGEPGGIFAAIEEAMSAVREVAPERNPRDLQREAFMRQALRAATSDAAQAAVVCGAWHVPALRDPGDAQADAALLATLPTVAVQATWIPWTYGRIAQESGYGAGVRSPAWYEHLWREPGGPAISWMARAAALLRAQDLPASPAEVVDAVRLAETLCALRGRRIAGLGEVTDAALAVLCHGDVAPLRLIRRHLVVGDVTGALPADAPRVPLLADIETQAEKLRLPMSSEKPVDLDLRSESGRRASHLLHRVHLLGIRWGRMEQARRARGTFHELWRLDWTPELVLPAVEASVWGITVRDASMARALALAAEVESVSDAARLLDAVLQAGLEDAAAAALTALDQRAALSTDTAQLMEAIPTLARISRYGDVRGTDVEIVGAMLRHFTERVCTSLRVACSGLDADEGRAMERRIAAMDTGLSTAPDEVRALWLETLRGVADARSTHPLCAGRCTRILAEAHAVDVDTLETELLRATSRPAEPADAAAWIEGFLAGSAMILLYEPRLWQVVDAWLSGLHADDFVAVLPLLRRTVSTLPRGEVRQLAEVVERGAHARGGDVDDERLLAALRPATPMLRLLLGIEDTEKSDA